MKKINKIILLTLNMLIISFSYDGGATQRATEKYCHLSVFGDVKLLIKGESGDYIEFQNTVSPNFNLVPNKLLGGSYRVIIYGESPTIYWINCHLTFPETKEYFSDDTTIADGGILNEDQSDTLVINFEPSPNLVYQIKKDIYPSLLRRDIDNLFRQGILPDNQINAKIIEIMNEYEKALETTNPNSAREHLIILRDTVDSYSRKKMKNKTISDGGFWILKRDIQYLIGED